MKTPSKQTPSKQPQHEIKKLKEPNIEEPKEVKRQYLPYPRKKPNKKKKR